METKWKTYYPAAHGPWLYNIWYFLPFQSLLFSAPLRCDVIAVWRDCFLAPSLISLAVITSGVKEVTWTYCTGCRKPAVGLHIMQRPTGPFQSNKTLYQNVHSQSNLHSNISYIQTICPVSDPDQQGRRAWFQKWDQAFKRPCLCLQAFVIITAIQRRLKCISSSCSFQSPLLPS